MSAFDPLRTLALPLTLVLMLTWLRNRIREANTSPLAKWSVRFRDNHIVTSDDLGASQSLGIADLRKVVVQTDDSGPWGADVLYFLFSDEEEPAGVFPIEAQGCQEFVNWLSTLSGYRDKELSRAMASTDVAKFVIFEAEG